MYRILWCEVVFHQEPDFDLCRCEVWGFTASGSRPLRSQAYAFFELSLDAFGLGSTWRVMGLSKYKAIATLILGLGYTYFEV